MSKRKPIADNQSVLDHGTIHPVFDHTIPGR